MRQTPQNKMLGAGMCSQCGRAKSPYGCRDVPLGEFCLQHGLKMSPDAQISPSVDPKMTAAENDPEVVAKADLEREATLRYEGVAELFNTAMEELTAARIKADGARRGTSYNPQSGEWVDHPFARKYGLNLKAKQVQVDALRTEMERVSEDLTRARVAYQDALNYSYMRHGLPVMFPNVSTRKTTIY